MSDEKRYDNRTEEEIIADLEDRRSGHVFITTAEAQVWNEMQPKTPQSKSHWSVKAASVRYVLRMGTNWKQLAKALWTDLREANARAASFEHQAMELSRMMVYCDKCKATPGETCEFRCSKDGSRDVQ